MLGQNKVEREKSPSKIFFRSPSRCLARASPQQEMGILVLPSFLVQYTDVSTDRGIREARNRKLWELPDAARVVARRKDQMILG